VEYLIEALAPSGTVLTTSGSETQPLSFSMPEARATAIDTDPEAPGRPPAGGEDLTALWVTLVVLAVLGGGGAVAGYFIAQELTKPQDGSLGNVSLPLLRF
jgi:hypothetical protein